MNTKNNTIGTKLKFQDLPTVDANKKLTAPEFNQLVDFQNSPVQQIAGSLDDTDIIIDGTKNYGTTIVVAGATRTITANASGHLQGNNIKQRYTFNVNCIITLSGFDTPGNNTGVIEPILAGTYDFIYQSNRNGINLIVLENIWRVNGSSIFYINGNVGIGTTTPDRKLEIVDTGAFALRLNRGLDVGVVGSAGVIVESGALDGATFKAGAHTVGTLLANGDDGQFEIQTRNANTLTQALLINKDQNVGIGTDSPDEKLEVNGNILADKLAANVAAILNTGDFGGAVAIGSGVAGISTAPTDGLLVEGRMSINTTGSIGMLNVNNENGSSVPAINIFGENPSIKQTLIRPSGGAVSTVVDLFGQTTGEASVKWGEIGVFGSMATSVATLQYIYFGAGEDVAFNDNTFRLYPGEIANFQGLTGFGPTAPAAHVDIDQSDNAAAIPALKLTQADLSEEMIKFDATIGVGNPIEAIGAKSFTQTHFLKINVEGLGVKYMPIGDLA